MSNFFSKAMDRTGSHFRNWKKRESVSFSEDEGVWEAAFVSTDSRTIEKNKNSIFIALEGENHDGHDFCLDAIQQGAQCLVVHKWKESWDKVLVSYSNPLKVIETKNTLFFLQVLANEYRKTLKAKIAAVTGSNGKTTVKDFSETILKSSGIHKTHTAKGSFNNHWGVPLTLLSAPPDTEIILIEMGMNHPGEIKKLCEIAEPDLVLCTTVGQAHLGFFRSIEEIAQAKEEIYLYTRGKAQYRVFNVGDPFTRQMWERDKDTQIQWGTLTPKTLLFGNQEGDSPRANLENQSAGQKITTKSEPISRRTLLQVSPELLQKSPQEVLTKLDVSLHLVKMTMEGIEIEGQIQNRKGRLFVPVFGAQNVNNLMAAAALTLGMGLNPEQIWSGIGKCKNSWGRSQKMSGRNGSLVFFDAYNANPDSMKMLLENIRLIQNQSKIDQMSQNRKNQEFQVHKTQEDQESQIKQSPVNHDGVVQNPQLNENQEHLGSFIQISGPDLVPGSEKKWIGVLGEMLEMGSQRESVHFELGKWAGNCHFDKLWFVGPSSKSFQEGFTSSQAQSTSLTPSELSPRCVIPEIFLSPAFDDQIAQSLTQDLGENTIFVIKASRGIKLEQFLKYCI